MGISCSQTIDLHEVRQHNTVGDCWIYVGRKVYNITDFIVYHPAGARVIINSIYKNGQDCSTDMEMHSPAARKRLNDFFIGYLS